MKKYNVMGHEMAKMEDVKWCVRKARKDIDLFGRDKSDEANDFAKFILELVIRSMFIDEIRAAKSDEEKENGVALVEMGAGVTSVTIYQGGILRYYYAIPFGGRSVTNDIKLECGFTEKLAENIKLGFGACMPDKLQSLSEKIIQINDEENGSYEQLPVKYLSEIITCRAREIIEAILWQIQDSGYADKLRNGIVLTGGGANLVNLANLFNEMSGYTVRIGYPRSQAFSAIGCSGTGEASAVASIGMILEAKRDVRLNCIEEAPAPAA